MLRTKRTGGAVLLLLLCAGAVVACQGDSETAPDTVAGTSPAATPSTSTGSPSAPSAPAGDTALVLSGKREVSIVRVQAPRGGLALDGQLVETSGENGRQRFVPTPIGGDQYVIKAYGRPDTGHPANDEPSCWQVNGIDVEDPMFVGAAVCDADNPIQRFTITATGGGAYAIGSESRFLQHTPASGLILRDPGGASPSTFRFVDRGPARVPAGG
jgi:hypothetical protein